MVAQALLRAFVALLLLFAVGCGKPVGNLTAIFGSENGIDIVRNATSVKAFRIQSPAAYHPLLANYEMTAGPLDVSDSAAMELRELLLDSANYDWDYAKGCIPDFGVRVQFQHESDSIDVLFCFECNLMVVFHNEKPVGGEDFDKARREIVAIVKGLFKDDKAIQSL